MNSLKPSLAATLPRDLTAGLVVFLVALPLCLGIALASNAPLFSGLVAGIVGGILVGILSGSQTSVSGPAAGLTAVVAAQITTIGSYEGFLLAVVLAGLIQIVMGVLRAGFLAAFFPSSVIKGLLAAIGTILILKQLPHVFGYDPDPQSNMAFANKGEQNTFSTLYAMFSDLHLGAGLIGVLSVALLFYWDKNKTLKKSPIPAPLIVVLLGVALSQLFKQFGENWFIEKSHLVQVPVAETLRGLFDSLPNPDYSQWRNSKVYIAAFTIAIVASLETLLNLQAVDKIDPKQRSSPPSRELWAQGVGNLVSGLAGGLPVTSVIVRSSVNINAGGQTKLAALFHGFLLLGCVAFLPVYLNMIPLSCLAAILLVTGIKLASPALVKQMWAGGITQFLPFIVTVVAIVFTDLLVGVLIGLAVSLSYILWNNARRPIRTILEKHLGGGVVKIELANQVSFLNRAALAHALNEIPEGGHVLLDASHTNYIDPDVLDLIRDFKKETAPARGIEVSLLGFRDKYQLHDQIQYVDYSTRELQSAISPAQVLDLLKNGHERFRSGEQLTRDYGRQVTATAEGEHPLAVVLSCVESRTPAELIFDVGLGDIYTVRIAGTVSSRKVIGSIEYGCAVAGAKLIVVMGHTRCGMIREAIEDVCDEANPIARKGSGYLGMIIDDIRKSIDPAICDSITNGNSTARADYVDTVSRLNITRVIETILTESPVLADLVKTGQIVIIGAMYDVTTGNLEFLPQQQPTVKA